MNRIFSKLLACAGLVVAFISPSAFGAATPTWTNAAGDNDPANASNWENGNPYTSSTKTFSKNFELGVDADWSATAIKSLNSKTVDLQGYSLTVSTFTDVKTSGTVTDKTTDTTKPGHFVVNVAAETPWENSKVTISGNLQFVKEGEGVFVGKKSNQLYKGGTVINAGTLQSYLAESSHYFGAADTPVTVNAGGTLDIYGIYGWAEHDITLNGGTLGNSNKNQTTYTSEGLGNITLTADSKVSLKYGIWVWKKEGAVLALGGHTLTVESTSTAKSVQFALNNAAVSGGTIACGPGIRFYTYSASATLADDVRLELNGCYDWYKKAAVSVGELVSNPTTSSDDNLVTVTKRFSSNGNFDNVQLADGAILDLTGNEGVFSTASGVGGRTMSFADGATITVDISGRTFKEGDKVISWSGIPSATFQWDSKTAEGGVPALVGSDGLFYGGGSGKITFAHWTNATGDDDIKNKENWACTNLAGEAVSALPTADTTVYLSGDIPITVPMSTSVTWGGVCLKGTLRGDFDLSGVTSVKFGDGTSFDLNGHTVRVGPISAESLPTMITDSDLGMPGAGALVLANGTSQLFADFTTDAGLCVRVAGGATLDLNGINGTVFKAILEDGSTVANTGAAVGSSSPTSKIIVIGGGLELAAGATAAFAISKNVFIRAAENAAYPLALNGGTLVKTGSGTLGIVNGDITGPGTINVADAELQIGSVGLSIADDVVIDVGTDGKCSAQSAISVPTILGDGTLKGSAYTITKRFSGLLQIDSSVALASGVTIDLTGNTGAYAIPDKVTVDEGATITLDLGGRKDLVSGSQIVSWTTAPSDTVRFLVSGAPYIVKREDNGLRLLSSEGLILGVR